MLILRDFLSVSILSFYLSSLGCVPLMDEPTYFKCKKTADCPRGYICEVYDKVCRATKGMHCEDDVICAEDLICHPDSKICVVMDENTMYL